MQVAHPDKSYEILGEMVAYVEGLVQKLGLPYRILRLCGGDMSFTSALTYDFEVYSAAQEKWLEVSSVSNFESFQANRLKLRYRDEETKKPVIAHTLNGRITSYNVCYTKLLRTDSAVLRHGHNH